MSDIIKENFKNPPSEYGSAPFWSWNGEMDADEVAFQLRDFKEHGMGGAFAHPRLGMVTEYLSEEFFRIWQCALDTVKGEDMKLYMYDENPWPSGFAGGLVADADPSTIGALAKYRVTPAAAPEFSGEVLFAAAADTSDGAWRLGEVLTDVPREEWGHHTDGDVMVIYSVMPFSSDWTGGHPYTDVTNPRTTELFLKITYEEYYRRFGKDFGTAIPAVFSDEANIHSEGLNTVPFTPHVQKRFRELSGYDLLPNLPAVFRNVEGVDLDRPAEKVRYDYYNTLHDLWITSFVQPISKWCEEHGIAWTGHDVEHQWPQSHGGRIAPSEQTTYEFRQWPGMDLLLCEHLRDTPSNFDKFEMYEIRSAANQFGKARTLCEAYGAGGYHSTLADYKRLGDFLLVGGINFIVQHLALYSYAGYRKRDCPQSFDYRQPWWHEYTEFARYIGRASFMLSQGRMEQRILLLNTSTSSYVIPGEEQDGTIDHELDVHCVRNPDMSDFLTVVNLLTDNQWDFDIGDEFSLARHGSIRDGRLKFGEQEYDIVIISKNMRCMRSDTAKLVLELAASGGHVVTTDGEGNSFAEYIDGETDRRETSEIRRAVERVCGADAIDGYIAHHIARRITGSAPFPTGVQHMRRLLPDGRVCYFFVNHSMGTFESELTLDGECAAEWDLFTGETRGIPCRRDNGKISFMLRLERCGAAMIVTGDDSPVRESLPRADEEVSLEPLSVSRESENTMTLDHISLELDGERHAPVYFLEACDRLFAARGFGADPWRSAIQRRSDWMDKNSEYGDGSGFAAHYTFTVAEGALPDRLVAAVERPNLVRVSVNGHEAKSFGRDILDRDMGAYDISAYVREGENTLTVAADRFNVLDELEAVILRGDFAVNRRADRFVIDRPTELGLGSWDDMGLVFYPYAVNYRYRAQLDAAPASAVISLGEHGATAVSVTVNGEYAGVIGRNGGSSLEICTHLRAGENTITVRVCGSMRNQLGPHLGYQKEIPYDWSFYTPGYAAVPSDYAFSRYGLDAAPTLKIAR